MPTSLPIEVLGPNEPLPPDALAEVAALAARNRAAGGMLMQLVGSAGGQIEGRLKHLPDRARAAIDRAARGALETAYRLAARSHVGPGPGSIGGSARAHRVLSTITGGLGGLGGLPTALAELPVTTAVIFRGIQGVAARHGFDRDDPAVRAECLKVFAAGGPLDADDGIDTGFLGARMALSGPAMNRLVALVAPRFAAILAQKLAAAAVPILGAVTGAGVNYAFAGYFLELAEVRFGLLRLAARWGEERVEAAFRAA